MRMILIFNTILSTLTNKPLFKSTYIVIDTLLNGYKGMRFNKRQKQKLIVVKLLSVTLCSGHVFKSGTFLDYDKIEAQ